MEFQYRKGYVPPPIDAQILGEELERLRGRDGLIIPKKVVQAARRQTSPLHSCFEWDDRKAADVQRIQRAMQLIRCVEVVQHPRDPADEPIRRIAYVSVGKRFTAGTSGYTTVTEALANPDTRGRVLADAQAQLRGWRRRFGFLEEMAGIVRAIDELDDNGEHQ